VKVGRIWGCERAYARSHWKFITSICREAGLSGNFGTHSLRKTWGYHARMSGVDLALIMHRLNHESIAYTKHYVDNNKKAVKSVLTAF